MIGLESLYTLAGLMFAAFAAVGVVASYRSGRGQIR